MKVRFFDIDVSHLPPWQAVPAPGPRTLNAVGLSAYAVDHADLLYNGQTIAVNGSDIKLAGDTITAVTYPINGDDTIILCIHYYGIRDYSLLFPKICALELARAQRLGLLYEEAEKSFETGAWLSFMLMCGSIFEHLLFFKLGKPNGLNTLQAVSAAALTQNVIDQDQFAIIDSTREARNVIHCNKLNCPYITRLQAMDARVLIEKLMLRL